MTVFYFRIPTFCLHDIDWGRAFILSIPFLPSNNFYFFANGIFLLYSNLCDPITYKLVPPSW